jgi:hypothetical protein
VEERLIVVPTGEYIRPDATVHEQPEPPNAAGQTGSFAVEDVIVAVADEEPLNEAYIEIVDHERNRDVVTVIELLSPTNKTSGDGRTQYLNKQQSVLASRTSLVEIDLLRAGTHTVAAPKELIERKGAYHYLSCVRRGSERDRYYVCRRTVREPLVPIRVPLAEDDEDIALDLPRVFPRCWEAANYALDVDYTHPLDPDDAAWADALLQEMKGR